MKTTFTNNTLTVITDIKAEAFKKGISDLSVANKEGEELFRVMVGEKPSISTFALTCNATVDSNLAVIMVLPMETTIDDVYKKYGKALVAAKKYTSEIAGKVEADEESIKEVFANN